MIKLLQNTEYVDWIWAFIGSRVWYRSGCCVMLVEFCNIKLTQYTIGHANSNFMSKCQTFWSYSSINLKIKLNPSLPFYCGAFILRPSRPPDGSVKYIVARQIWLQLCSSICNMKEPCLYVPVLKGQIRQNHSLKPLQNSQSL